MSVTMMQTSAASALNSLWESSVTSNQGKSAGTTHRNIHTPSEWPEQLLLHADLISSLQYIDMFFCLIDFCLYVDSICIMFLSISPSQGLCCGQECEFKPAGQTCDDETDCQRASVCSGLSPLCPEPSAKENLTVCSQGTRVCMNGVRQQHPSRHSVTQQA